MSFTSKVIALWCKKHGNDDGVDVYDAPAATACIEGNVCNWHGDFVSFVPVALVEGDDDDDDGGYDYAPAA
ncbi:hypothetical protein AAZX31_05G010900 [Glycine max]|uniref:Uncharacterized protein n=2 Tax=Glycine subgen. Soja TaxID=1462606 RepID=C6T1M0_SOYBN|nr:uncharacterized protein LOC100500399 [Glycine max]KAG5027836.1 hypothetical protein JHK87_011350 [Glycine soja]ACU15470.1 unknown [Glycine max]KAG5039314.1 hypothetical protein JHK85_011790 [Glycine max]KAG5056466.1 hypothetical protein JHK86_011462 [Glycine max]KAG5153501.1 hypothetical protein JHK82_011470 [Glycine max]|eukprot:NP_001351454.1 uncharacterized protein LOC100500399 [Glycine max]